MAVWAVADLVNARAVQSGILNRLRLETRSEHDAVERMLDLMGPALTRETYCQRLVQFYGFYGALEAALHAQCAAAHLQALSHRLHKTTLLRQDLQYLGVSTDALPLCRHLPLIKDQTGLLGCLYVLEGATLGGRVITQHIYATLGITPATGGSFFEGYGNDTGKMWQAMRQLLVRCATDLPTEQAIVESAVSTFACLRGWCDPAGSCVKNNTQNHTEAQQRA